MNLPPGKPQLINFFEQLCLGNLGRNDIVGVKKGHSGISFHYIQQLDVGYYPRIKIIFDADGYVKAWAKHEAPELAAQVINHDFSGHGALAVPQDDSILAVNVRWANMDNLWDVAQPFRAMLGIVFCNAWLMHKIRHFPKCEANVYDVTYGQDRSTLRQFAYDLWNHFGTTQVRVTATSPKHGDSEGSVVIQAGYSRTITESVRRSIKELGGSYEQGNLVISPYRTIQDVERVLDALKAILLLHEQIGLPLKAQNSEG